MGDNPEIHVTGALWLKSEIQADLPSKDPNIYKKKPYNILSAIKEKKKGIRHKKPPLGKKIYIYAAHTPMGVLQQNEHHLKEQQKHLFPKPIYSKESSTKYFPD